MYAAVRFACVTMASSDARFEASEGGGTPSVFARFESSEEPVSGISTSPSSSGAFRFGSGGPVLASVMDRFAYCFAGRGIGGIGSSSAKPRTVRRWSYASFHSVRIEELVSRYRC